jgi:hypothetical protein
MRGYLGYNGETGTAQVEEALVALMPTIRPPVSPLPVTPMTYVSPPTQPAPLPLPLPLPAPTQPSVVVQQRQPVPVQPGLGPVIRTRSAAEGLSRNIAARIRSLRQVPTPDVEKRIASLQAQKKDIDFLKTRLPEEPSTARQKPGPKPLTAAQREQEFRMELTKARNLAHVEARKQYNKKRGGGAWCFRGSCVEVAERIFQAIKNGGPYKHLGFSLVRRIDHSAVGVYRKENKNKKRQIVIFDPYKATFGKTWYEVPAISWEGFAGMWRYEGDNWHKASPDWKD